MVEEITIPVALMHTGVAMATVFTILILISFVIWLLKFVPKLFEKKEKAPEPVKKTTDGEIVAVIAAAIAASMTEETGVPVSPDGLVIRSIRKRNF